MSVFRTDWQTHTLHTKWITLYPIRVWAEFFFYLSQNGVSGHFCSDKNIEKIKNTKREREVARVFETKNPSRTATTRVIPRFLAFGRRQKLVITVAFLFRFDHEEQNWQNHLGHDFLRELISLIIVCCKVQTALKTFDGSLTKFWQIFARIFKENFFTETKEMDNSNFSLVAGLWSHIFVFNRLVVSRIGHAIKFCSFSVEKSLKIRFRPFETIIDGQTEIEEKTL